MLNLFKLLSDENRLKIFILLLNKELCICEIEKQLKLKQANVSKHMMHFKELNIVEMRKEAQWVYYKMREDFINEHIEFISFIQNKAMSSPEYNHLFQCHEHCNC